MGSDSMFRLRASRASALLAAIATVLILAACGDSGSDTADTAAAEQEIEEAALAYGESEGSDACDFLSQSAIETLGGPEGCASEFESVPAAEFEIEEVEVSGDTATASVRNVQSDQVIDLELVNEDESWKIAMFPGLGDASSQ